MPKILKRPFLVVLLCLGMTKSFAQVCTCPSTLTCKPCSGGYTSLTLRYTGTTTAFVLIVDGTNNLANVTVSPRQEFTISGSKRNEKFVDKSVPVLVNGVPNTVLGSSCVDVQVGGTYGLFTVVAAESIGGSTVCCTTPPPDITRPQIINVPPPISVQATTGCGTQVMWSEPIATDNCSLKSFTSTHTSGQTFPPGTTTVEYTATDEAGNISTSSFTVTVADHKAPELTGGPGADILLNAGETCSAVATWKEPHVIDDCNVMVERSHAPGSTFQLGSTKVEYIATDASGNKSLVSFKVVVTDRQPPEFISFPQAIVAEARSMCSAEVSWLPPQATDRCSAVTLTSSHPSGTTFPLGITKVKFVARDDFGNTTERELTVTVEDKVALEVVKCPNDITITADESSAARAWWAMPQTNSSCEPVTIQSSHDPGDLFSLGKTTVEYVAATPSGKKAYCTFNVSVSEKEKNLEVSKIVTPDGDGLNDAWIISNIDRFRDNQVTIFDRWGGLVFQAARYNNESIVWRGTNRSGVSVPTGTYFYTIVAQKGSQKIQETGAIELVR